MNRIYEGLLDKQPFFVKVLDKSHLPKVLDLQEVVYDALPNKDILQPLSEEEFLVMLEGSGLIIGAFVGETLIAFRAVVAPKIDEKHLGYDIGLVDESDLKRVLYQEISNVHPDYRGYGLQKTLAKVIMRQIDMNQYDYLAATVMPYNIASLKDKFAQGFYIVALKYIYGGKLRYVFALDLREEPIYEDEPVTISMGDIETQQRLIQEGFIGVAMKSLENDWVVIYKKKR
ncbi:GNAT family N-acetyltransferase [Ureibacillus sp. 179-F W5.1 NHS]|uniref:GNAT family N-acetyltransferase n=1 Tax=Lysinibacillus halotolerans TaxID=1368476 RepID=A0A3M8HAA2_9BACI|nr:GNAT family N-acetyltransferase [Lysinibacillus halotolerans]RNC99306.1 GNAT family N-acetyltransferase [Lysinibacillus halotolerans]